jgi:hypothetical protein
MDSTVYPDMENEKGNQRVKKNHKILLADYKIGVVILLLYHGWLDLLLWENGHRHRKRKNYVNGTKLPELYVLHRGIRFCEK